MWKSSVVRVGLLSALALSAGSLAAGPPTFQPTAQTVLTRWEYRVVDVNDVGLAAKLDRPSWEELLNRLGDEGWEYTSDVKNGYVAGQILVFKRPKLAK